MSAPSRQDCQSSVAVTGLSKVRGQAFGEDLSALRAARVHPDFSEVEQVVQQPHVPIGRSAGAYVSQNFRLVRREVLRPDGGERAGPHFRDGGGIDDCPGHSSGRVEKIEQSHFRWKALSVIVDVVTDDLDPRCVQGLDVTAKYIEVAVECCPGAEVHPGFDNRRALAGGAEPPFDGFEYFIVTECKGVDVPTVQPGEVDPLHRFTVR